MPVLTLADGRITRESVLPSNAAKMWNVYSHAWVPHEGGVIMGNISHSRITEVDRRPQKCLSCDLTLYEGGHEYGLISH
jgi:hypothetical protein